MPRHVVEICQLRGNCAPPPKYIFSGFWYHVFVPIQERNEAGVLNPKILSLLTFSIHFEDGNRDVGVFRRSRVLWFNLLELGVAFEGVNNPRRFFCKESPSYACFWWRGSGKGYPCLPYYCEI
jgi:hypothetical protein